MAPKKVVYLFGAGATHAELTNLYPKQSINQGFLEKNGLLISQVSKRVFKNASDQGLLKKTIKNLLSYKTLSNIELFISLIRSNRIESEKIIKSLIELIEQDLTGLLDDWRLKRFYLHKSLLELHSKIKDKEELIGLISLNYDNVLDDAYETVKYPPKIEYCTSFSNQTSGIPFLKLHGGFKLKDKKNRKIPIMTPGINKNYLELPYNFIWGRALEILINCDILRVIGCSLSPNDIGLVDLLFKAHLARGPIEIEIINADKTGREIKENYGFFSGIKTVFEIENRFIVDPSIELDSTTNPFKVWLKSKIERMLEKPVINKTKYLKKISK